MATSDQEHKPFHCLVLDAGPIIRNTPPVSTLIQTCHKIVTLPAVISEIRDDATRSRLDATLRPFLEVREPRQESVKFVADFARQTGDLAVLSRTDIQVAALAYELECERNGGDWRLRRTPGQKQLNGKTISKDGKENPTQQRKSNAADATSMEVSQTPASIKCYSYQEDSATSKKCDKIPEKVQESKNTIQKASSGSEVTPIPSSSVEDLSSNLSSLIFEAPRPVVVEHSPPQPESIEDVTNSDEGSTEEGVSDTDSGSTSSEGWITPGNLDRHVSLHSSAITTSKSSTRTQFDVGTVTTDFTLQNVLLLINLHVLSAANLMRITKVRTTALRCHGCFKIEKDTRKQFCPRCGQPTLTRVNASSTSDGHFSIHLKKDWQWNHRGERYSVPKPVAGTPSGKGARGGGHGGWGNDLILAEDQKEYIRALGAGERRNQKERDIMDEDALPGILSGERRTNGGRPKVGAGRNINAKRRRKR